VKNEYFGDVNDFWKYAILRALGAAGLRVFVCWMLTAPASGRDGRKLAYLEQAARYRPFDPELFDALAVAVRSGRRDVRVAEEELLDGAGYYGSLLGDAAAERAAYFEGLWRAAAGYDVLFFDPDNGIERGVRKGRVGSHRYVYLDEVAEAFARGQTPVVFQHFTREPRAEFLARTAERARAATQAGEIVVASTPNVAYFAALRPEHGARVRGAFAELEARPASRVSLGP
jgi:hypothetical protein